MEEYEEFGVYLDRGAADSLSARLESEGVPSYIESRLLANGRETEFVVFVPRKLSHRARWIVWQLQPNDAELEFLATGKLPGQPQEPGAGEPESAMPAETSSGRRRLAALVAALVASGIPLSFAIDLWPKNEGIGFLGILIWKPLFLMLLSPIAGLIAYFAVAALLEKLGKGAG